MKRFIILAAALLCAVATNAQQLKTAQGITIESEPEPKPKKTLTHTGRGFEQSVEVGVHSELLYDAIISGEYIAGYRFNNYLFLGGGTGLEWYINGGDCAIPIYANARLYLLPKSRWQPFVSLSLGALVPIAKGSDSGYYRKHYDGTQLHINPTIGVNYRINSKYSCYLNLGYMPRWLYHYYHYNGYKYTSDRDCLTIRLGVTF
ncbi:MAG: hypothetical protein IJW88_04885 [Alistipes sp.]|nr:hypothetical protein [Alistipes sp.]